MELNFSSEVQAMIADAEKRGEALNGAIGGIGCNLINLACKAVPIACVIRPDICPVLTIACKLAKHWCARQDGETAADGEMVTLSEGDLEKYCEIYKTGRGVLVSVLPHLPGPIRRVVTILMDGADAVCGISAEASGAVCGCG